MPLSDVINVTIRYGSDQISRAGFGVPGILSIHTRFAERIKYVERLKDLTDLGFVAADPAYAALTAILAQPDRPKRVAILRRAAPVAQISRVAVGGTADGLYRVTLTRAGVAVNFDFTASGNTAAEIRDGLIALIDASALYASVIVDGTTLSITSSEAGIPFAVTLTSPSNALTTTTPTPNVGITEDLNACEAEAAGDVSGGWYATINCVNGSNVRSTAEIYLAAAWTETRRKIFIAQSSQAAVLAATYNPADTTTDIASQLKGLNYARTAYVHHDTDTEYVDAAWVGARIAILPGSETWALEALAGVPGYHLTTTQRTYLLAKGGNYYETPIAGISVMQAGTMAGGSFIDVTHGTDQLEARISEDIFARLSRSPKPPYTDAGIAQIAAVFETAVRKSITDGFLAEDPAPSFEVPLFSETTEADRTARILRGLSAIAKTAGGVHQVVVEALLTV